MGKWRLEIENNGDKLSSYGPEKLINKLMLINIVQNELTSLISRCIDNIILPTSSDEASF